MDSNTVFFELSGNGNYLRLEPFAYERSGSDNYYDDNWVRTRIFVKGGSFSGQYEASILTEDFEYLHENFLLLHKNLIEKIGFTDKENNLLFFMEGNDLGHFTADITVNDNSEQPYCRLAFTISFDQSYIKPIVSQLDRLTREFPVITINEK